MLAVVVEGDDGDIVYLIHQCGLKGKTLRRSVYAQRPHSLVIREKEKERVTEET